MQITLEGKTKEQVAIERLKQYEPPEGYILAFSGGKESISIYKLAELSLVKFEAHYNVTNTDPIELVQFIKQYYPTVKRDIPKVSMWHLIEKKGPPTRMSRWCCEKLKERGHDGRVVITGIRSEESFTCRNRPVYLKRKKQILLNPIIDWTLLDVWDFIDKYKLPYCSLYDTQFDRLGCIGCPLSSNQAIEFKLYPKIAEAWHRAVLRSWEYKKEHSKMNMTMAAIKDGEDYWQWWLSGKSIKEYTKQNQEVMELGV